MKVLHVETGMHLYGGAKQVTYITKGLQELGVSNVLCTPKNSDIGEWASQQPIQVRNTDSAGDLDFRFYRQLSQIMRDEKPDLVHLHSRRGADVLGGIAAKSNNIPCILSRRVDNKESKWAVKIKYRLYDHVITISEGIKRVLLSEGVPDNKITCVHSAVDAEKYATPESRRRFLEEFRLPEDTFCIGVVAQLIQRKGHRYLLEVLPELVQQYPNIRVLIFGKGALKDDLKTSVAELGLADHVQFTGFRNDLEKWLGCLDLVVHPAEIEGLGVSLLQAASAGVPIIASNAGGMPEVVHHQKNGLLIEVGDTQSLAAGIRLIMDDEKLRSNMQKAGPEIIQQYFSIPSMIQGNLQVYRQVLSARS